MRSFTLPACAAVKKEIGRNSADHWRLFDSPAEIADFVQARCQSAANSRGGGSWYGHEDGATIARHARGGDPSRVASSDALLDRFERFAFETERKAWRDDIAGGFPNVPAYLAGHPLAMRRRMTDATASAPLAIVVDLATSSGVSSKTIERRGAAILALTRLLTMRRPVELWAGCLTGAGHNDRECAAIFTKIATQPLDLATAAYVMTSAGFPRCLIYSVAKQEAGFCYHWPYRDHTASRKHLAAICAQGFSHATETLCVPAVHVQDDIADDPEGWIERKLAELAPAALDAA